MEISHGLVFGRLVTHLLTLLSVLLATGLPTSEAQEPIADPGTYREADQQETSSDPAVKARVQYELGLEHSRLERFEDALGAYSRALGNLQPGTERALRASILQAQGMTYQSLEQYLEAANNFQQVIELRQGEDPAGLARAYGNLGSAYTFQGSYAKALFSYRNALNVVEAMQSPSTLLLSKLHNDIGMVYVELGDYTNALAEFELALSLLKASSNKKSKGRVLHHMGYAHFRRGEQENIQADIKESIKIYGEALVLRREAADLDGEGKTLNSLGYSYAKLGRYQEALEVLNEALALARMRGDRMNEGRTLDSIAIVYMEKRDYAQALEYLYEALLIAREIGDRGAEHIILANIGRVFQRQERPQLAIVFLKQSVEVIEKIREELQGLPASARQTYAESVSATYRVLADLLLSQNRPLEAERVIDLLRVEELSEYLGRVRGSGAQLHHLPGEEEVWEIHLALLARSISQAKELAELKKIHKSDRTPEQQARVQELRADQANTKKLFRQLKDSQEVRAALKTRRLEAQIEAIELEEILNLSEHLGKNEMLFYPFVLPNRLELIFATANSVPVNLPQPVSEKKLKDTIFAFRQALMRKGGNPKALGRQLYEWLLEPLERAEEMLNLPAGEKIDTIVYVPDGMLRYIPLAALHDGEDWLVRKYRVNLITARSLSGLGRAPSDIVDVLAGAYTRDIGDIHVAGDIRTFKGLPYARTEVENLKKLYPDASIHIDEGFTPDNFVYAFEDFQLVHMATHGVFVPGRPPEESFILFGDGERASLSDIRDTWLLRNVEMVVLSACETGVGGLLGNGEEIHGFGYLMQKAGANAVIASLWEVSDGGTQALMSTFYRYLKQPGTSKAEALRQAQLALIDDSLGAEVKSSLRGAIPQGHPAASARYSHPFYWAPFVLIGNGS